MKDKNKMKRRTFISAASATATTITIVPRHVLGGPGRIAPSDKITIANIGCGTQGLRELPGLVTEWDPGFYTKNSRRSELGFRISRYSRRTGHR